MNSRFRARLARFAGRRWKSLIISIVILFEVAAIAIVATNAWVETVSSIKITNETNTTLTVDTYVFTDATIGGTSGTIDLGKYFKQAGDMHLAPASSADGVNMFFPKAGDASLYRKGDTSDKNTNYLSVTFRLKADTNADFFFTTNPDINVDNNIRVSVTAYTEGTTSGDLYDKDGKPLYTKIYANSKSAQGATVVNSTSGSTGATSVEAFSAHKKGTGTENRLFAVGANETKIVTINIWLQKVSGDMDSVMSASQAIQNLGIISSLTPRHVTLIPTPTWDANSPTYYAWCYNASNGAHDKLFKLELDENEHYSFDYPGNYRNTTFVRAVPGCTVQEGEYNSWPFVLSTNNNHHDDNHYWNQTVDTTIPNDPIDPTYIIETISGGTNSKSTGDWSDPVTVNIAYVTGQDNNYGSISATTYIGTSTSDHIMEQTNSSSQKHKTTLHGWNGKHIKLTATAKSNYAFVGWFDNAAGTGSALSTDFNISAIAGGEVTYYAKFKETRTLTIYRYLDGSSSSASCGTITIGGTNSTSGSSYSKTFDKGSSVAFSATAATGYTLSGIYTTDTGTTTASSPVTLNSDTSYYARFTTNSYNVTAHAYYSTNNGSSYTADNSTGGTVKAGSSSAGATSTASVKYKSSVNLVASPASGYNFVGWYDAASGGTQLSTNTTYSYTLSTTGAKNVYARFVGETWELGYGPSGGNWSYASMSVSGNNATCSLTLTEGQDFSFKVRKTVGSTSTYYGGGGSYSDITSTNFISNLSLTTSGGDTYMKGHAGTYTFTYNKSTGVLNVTVSYSNITITFDASSTTWVGDASAIVYCDTDGSGYLMTKSGNKWTAQVPSNKAGTYSFKRNNPGNTATWNQWNPSDNRGYRTTYKTSGDGTGSWQ